METKKSEENAGKPMKKTKKMKEKQWTSKENGGKPLKMQGK